MANDFGPKPTLTWVRIADLSADPAYQRSIETRRGQKLIAEIGERFRWPLFGVITIAASEEGFKIIDGQHRCEGARLAGIETVPATIIEGMTRAEQAMLFVDANQNRVSMTALAMHHAKVAGGDDLARKVARAAKKAGVEILRYPVPRANLKPGQTLAIGTMNTVARMQGEDVLRETLSIVRETWPDPGSVTADRIKGLASCVHSSGAEKVRAALSRDLAAFEREVKERGWDIGLPVWHGVRDAVYARFHGARTPRAARTVEPAALNTQPSRRNAFERPVNRRCEACHQIFQTQFADETSCEKCRAAA